MLKISKQVLVLLLILSFSVFAERIQNPRANHSSPIQGKEDGTWTTQSTNFPAASTGLQYIQVLSDQVVWGTGYDGSGGGAYFQVVTRTTNGGTNWVAKPVTTTAGYGSAMIYAVDATTAYVPLFHSTAGGGRIYKTTDGGTTWTHQTTATYTAPNGFPNIIHFFDANNGFTQGDPNGGYFEFYTTTNGGTNWVRVPQANIPAALSGEYGVVGYYSAIGNHIWFSTNKGRVYRSTDRGLNWTVHTTPIGNYQFKIKMRDAANGLAFVPAQNSPVDNKSYRTIDSGKTWVEFTPTGTFYGNDFCHIPGTPNVWVSTGAATGLSGASYSLNDGASWTDFDGRIGIQHTAVGFANNNVGWAGNFTDQLTPATVGGVFKFTGFVAANPVLSGDYFIPKGANPKGFTSLKQAFDSLNAVGVSGTVRFLIDGNLTETGNLLLNRQDMTATNKLVIKPATGKTPTITVNNFGTDLYGILFDGTDYVTIDGTNGTGTSRDLTFMFDDATNGQWAIEILNNADNMTIKNCNIKYTNMKPTVQTAGIAIDGAETTGAADNVLIQNCMIGDETKAFETGVGMWGNSAASPVSGKIENCIIYAGRRAITTFFIAKNSYIGNSIYITSPVADKAFYSAIYITGSVADDTTVIANNRIFNLKGNSSTSRFVGGIVVYGNTGVINAVNNFIAPNFSNLGTNTTFRVYGVVFGSATWNGIMNMAYNTILITPTTSTGVHACVGTEVQSAAILNMMNNIYVNNHTGTNSYGIHWTNAPSATSQLNADYNNIYVPNGLVGKSNTTDYTTLADWKTGSGQDPHSVSRNVNFVSNTDLHLTGNSIGDIFLAGLPIASVLYDIDGQLRSVAIPYMGADEHPESPLPVELVSFSGKASSNGITLNWETATETNNLGFQVERSSDGTTFAPIGFVKGNGTTTTQKAYSYHDASAVNGSFYYRLKQIDLDGNTEYSAAILVENTIPAEFALAQNYPNPFNPSTTISFTLPVSAKVTLKIYDIAGSEISTLTDRTFDAGRFDIVFDASKLASGTYLYVLQANGADGNNFTQVKKMLLMK